jgi:hypothetical protein
MTYVPTTIQWVAMHEVEDALYANFLSQLLLAVGASGLFSSIEIAAGSLRIPIWSTALGLVLLGVLTYGLGVMRKWRSLKKRRVQGGSVSPGAVHYPMYSTGT